MKRDKVYTVVSHFFFSVFFRHWKRSMSRNIQLFLPSKKQTNLRLALNLKRQSLYCSLSLFFSFSSVTKSHMRKLAQRCHTDTRPAKGRERAWGSTCVNVRGGKSDSHTGIIQLNLSSFTLFLPFTSYSLFDIILSSTFLLLTVNTVGIIILKKIGGYRRC